MKELTIHIRGESRTPQDCFDFGQSAIITIVTSLGPQLSREALACLARGLFSGGMASLQSVEGDAKTREAFQAFMTSAPPGVVALAAPSTERARATEVFELRGDAYALGGELSDKVLSKLTRRVIINAPIPPEGHEAFFAGLLTHFTAMAGTFVQADKLAAVLDTISARMREMPAELREEFEVEQAARSDGASKVH